MEGEAKKSLLTHSQSFFKVTSFLNNHTVAIQITNQVNLENDFHHCTYLAVILIDELGFSRFFTDFVYLSLLTLYKEKN